tara:strand:- start:190 stop:555 length:366 start_codon:yes stop_codon:yes gene_type:complete
MVAGSLEVVELLPYPKVADGILDAIRLALEGIPGVNGARGKCIPWIGQVVLSRFHLYIALGTGTILKTTMLTRIPSQQLLYILKRRVGLVEVRLDVFYLEFACVEKAAIDVSRRIRWRRRG